MHHGPTHVEFESNITWGDCTKLAPFLQDPQPYLRTRAKTKGSTGSRVVDKIAPPPMGFSLGRTPKYRKT